MRPVLAPIGETTGSLRQHALGFVPPGVSARHAGHGITIAVLHAASRLLPHRTARSRPRRTAPAGDRLRAQGSTSRDQSWEKNRQLRPAAFVPGLPATRTYRHRRSGLPPTRARPTSGSPSRRATCDSSRSPACERRPRAPSACLGAWPQPDPRPSAKTIEPVGRSAARPWASTTGRAKRSYARH